MNVLEIDSVVHSYNRKKVLTDVFLKCTTGEIIGILGKNGSGKSTLINIIFGFLKADSFSMHINGEYIDDTHRDARIVCLPQESFLPHDITVKRCINLFLNPGQNRDILLEDERIHLFLDQQTGWLSSGERRYLEVQLILNLQSDFVLLDEPFTELEPIYREKVKASIQIQLKNKCFIITDQNYRNITDISTRLFLLSGGGLEEIADSSELLTRGYLPHSVAEF